MLKGTTRSGFAFEIPDARCRNMELVDALAAVDHGNLNELPTALAVSYTHLTLPTIRLV